MTTPVKVGDVKERCHQTVDCSGKFVYVDSSDAVFGSWPGP